MNKREYDKEIVKWGKYWETYMKYHDRKIELIKKLGGYTQEECDKISEILKKEFGDELKLACGPWTKIYDQRDLMDPSFILPGMNESFTTKDYSQKVIDAFGKTVMSDDAIPIEGRVIGYAYDALDDYLIVLDDNGKEQYLILNSHWKVLEDKEKEDK